MCLSFFLSSFPLTTMMMMTLWKKSIRRRRRYVVVLLLLVLRRRRRRRVRSNFWCAFDALSGGVVKQRPRWWWFCAFKNALFARGPCVGLERDKVDAIRYLLSRHATKAARTFSNAGNFFTRETVAPIART